MHLKLKLLSGRGAVVHRMELGDRCSSYAKLRETVSALFGKPEPVTLTLRRGEEELSVELTPEKTGG